MNGGQFRFYRWEDPATGETTDLLSVTSVRQLVGESYQLVAWKMANLADAALGTMKRTVIGPRGGVKDVRQVFEFPCEFARMYNESEGQQERIDALRAWLREQADEPRNVAAARGTMVHAALERNVPWDRIERPWVENEFANLSQKDRKRIRRAVSDEDINFVRNSVRHYWDMRESVPMVLLAREVRVVNVSVGYAGTFDALAWLLGTVNEAGEFIAMSPDRIARARALDAEAVTMADIADIGGTLTLLDWKTSAGVHTDQVVQAHAYLSAEFAVVAGHRHQRFTDMLEGAMFGGLAHIRPNGWALHLFRYEPEAVRAFLGSVAFARFLARNAEPTAMFAASLTGGSLAEDEEVDA